MTDPTPQQPSQLPQSTPAKRPMARSVKVVIAGGAVMLMVWVGFAAYMLTSARAAKSAVMDDLNVSVVECDGSLGFVSVVVDVANKATERRSVYLKVEVYDGSTKVGKGGKQVSVAGGRTERVEEIVIIAGSEFSRCVVGT